MPIFLGRTSPFRGKGGKVWNRRNLVVAAHSGEGLLTIPFADLAHRGRSDDRRQKTDRLPRFVTKTLTRWRTPFRDFEISAFIRKEPKLVSEARMLRCMCASNSPLP
jgi:hypothetical protein